MIKLTSEQLSVSTAEVERSYFSEPPQPETTERFGSTMPTGTYRIVDGALYLVLPNAPSRPELDAVDMREQAEHVGDPGDGVSV